MTSTDELFEMDHAPGSMLMRASWTAGLVLPSEHLPSYIPGPLAQCLHYRGGVPVEPPKPADPLVIGLMEMGHRAEDDGELLLKKRGIELFRRDPNTRLERTSEDIGYHNVAYPDGICWDDWGAEFKLLTGGRRQFDEEWSDGPPLHHLAQVTSQMIASDAQVIASDGAGGRPMPGVRLVAIIPRRAHIECEVIEIERDAEREAAVTAACTDFWRILIDQDQLPKATPDASSYRALLKTTTLAEETVRLHGYDIQERVASWQRTALHARAVEAVKMSAQAELAALMGAATRAELDDGTVVSRKAIAGRTETKPRVVSPSWRWKVTEPKT